jgi:protease I
MTADLTGKKIAFLVDNAGVEQVELTAPWHAFLKAGAETVLIAPAKDVVQAFENDVEKADTFAGKPVAAICHGPWALVEADVVDGKRLTSSTASG